MLEVSTMRQRPRGRLTLAFVKASVEAQQRLLELADLDTELSRLDHRRRTLPEIAELSQLGERAAKARDAITIAETNLSDIDRELTRAERDVEQVRVRIDKDNTRLNAGQVSNARELESLQSEVASLRRRQSDLEEVVLELMEKRENAQALRDGSAAEGEAIAADTAIVAARHDTALAEIGAQTDKATSARAQVAAGIPADLLALYDKIRASSGLGAAPLRRGQCTGCREMLSTVELNAIRAAAPDEVVRHEECRRILVRTPDSGLKRIKILTRNGRGLLSTAASMRVAWPASNRLPDRGQQWPDQRERAD
jgi:predicted  nucleic acid-binding Zn-ribbon protein